MSTRRSLTDQEIQRLAEQTERLTGVVVTPSEREHTILSAIMTVMDGFEQLDNCDGSSLEFPNSTEHPKLDPCLIELSFDDGQVWHISARRIS